jgi:anti-sigma regulatory factor (Ser/Thr protein kinase)
VTSDSHGAPGDQESWSERHDLPDDASAAGIARDKARRFVRRLRMDGVIEPLTLVVSELVGNAVRHGRPPVQLLIRRVGRGVRVDVHDEAPGTGMDASEAPVPLPDLDAPGGRGRFLVDALSAKHGVHEIPDDGKEVWAVVEADEPRRT